MDDNLVDFLSERRERYEWIRSEFLRGLCAEGKIALAKQIAELSEADFIALCKQCREASDA